MTMMPEERLTLNDINYLQEIAQTPGDTGIAVRINQTIALSRSVIRTGKILNHQIIY
ncbi:MAG: hypothetical protein U9N40_04325 [Euryarchaeota archaeon]|nr:hypothetical protein [Euryarchaeota archaeon]